MMVGFNEKAICRKVGNVFALSEGNVIDFPKQWLLSELNRQMLEMEPAIISQSPRYILECFREQHPVSKTKEHDTNDIMYWLGYILTFFQFEYSISGKDVWARYDIGAVLENYDVLHTLSSKTAARMIKEEFGKGKRIRDKIGITFTSK